MAATQYSPIDDEEITLFRNRTDVYTALEEEHTGENNLYETIQGGTISNKAYHATTVIRRIANDTIYPYDTDYIYKWLSRSPTDPYTREDLSYTLSRVREKHHWLSLFPDITTEMVTPEFKKNLLTQWMDRCKTHANTFDEFHEKARAFVDVSSLETAGYLIVSSFEESNELLPKFSKEKGNVPVWMIRKSSFHNKIMPHAEVFTICFFIPKSGDNHVTVKHVRFMCVDGVGIFRGTTYKSFKALSQKRRCKPDNLCVIDILMSFVKKGLSPENLFTG